MRSAPTLLLAAICGLATPALAQGSVDNGLEVRVNPGAAAGSSQTLLYPGGEYSRSVPQLLYPGQSGVIHLHMPTRTHRAVVTRTAHKARAPKTNDFFAQAPAPKEKPAPKPKRVAKTAPPSAAKTDDFFAQAPAPQPTPAPKPKRVAKAEPPPVPAAKTDNFFAQPPAPKPKPAPKPTRVAKAEPAPAPQQQAGPQADNNPYFAAPNMANVFGGPPAVPAAAPKPATRPAPTPRKLASAAPPPAAASSAPPPASEAGLTKRSVILFAKDAPNPAEGALKSIGFLATDLSNAMTGPASRVELQAYGGNHGDKGSDARRLSLKRALAIRQILIEDGLSADRIDVRAMGGNDDSGPSDRVDVFVRG